MKKFVVDASVAVKWFFPEIHSTAAERLFDPEVYVSAPDLLVPEVGNAVWKRVRRREITAAEAAEIVATFAGADIALHPSRDLLPPALQLAVTLDRTVYDSLYLALAIALDCPLVTADERFYGSAAGSSFATHIRWVADEW